MSSVDTGGESQRPRCKGTPVARRGRKLRGSREGSARTRAGRAATETHLRTAAAANGTQTNVNLHQGGETCCGRSGTYPGRVRLYPDRAPRCHPDHRHPCRDRTAGLPGPAEEGQDSEAKSNARNMVSQVEACFAETQSYAGCDTTAELQATGAEPATAIGTADGQVTITAPSGTDLYRVRAYSRNASHTRSTSSRRRTARPLVRVVPPATVAARPATPGVPKKSAARTRRAPGPASFREPRRPSFVGLSSIRPKFAGAPPIRVTCARSRTPAAASLQRVRLVPHGTTDRDGHLHVHPRGGARGPRDEVPPPRPGRRSAPMPSARRRGGCNAWSASYVRPTRFCPMGPSRSRSLVRIRKTPRAPRQWRRTSIAT